MKHRVLPLCSVFLHAHRTRAAHRHTFMILHWATPVTVNGTPWAVSTISHMGLRVITSRDKRCTSVTIHQAHAQPPTIVRFFVGPQHPPGINKKIRLIIEYKFGVIKWFHSRCRRLNAIEVASIIRDTFVKVIHNSYLHIFGRIHRLICVMTWELLMINMETVSHLLCSIFCSFYERYGNDIYIYISNSNWWEQKHMRSCSQRRPPVSSAVCRQIMLFMNTKWFLTGFKALLNLIFDSICMCI